jgi:hypothetical protein
MADRPVQPYWNSVINMRKIETLALAASLSIAGAFAANAALLDFTDLNTFTGPDAISADANGASGVIAGVTWTLTPSTTPMRYNFAAGNGVFSGANDGFDGQLSNLSVPLALEGDGIGIVNDEITSDIRPVESLTLSFSEKVKIKSLHFLDLFFSDKGTESVKVFADTAMTILLAEFSSNEELAVGYSGYKKGLMDYVGKSLTFRAAGGVDDTTRDFSLAGANVAAVPVPAAGLLLLTAVGGLAAARRRKA